ncbi:MAG TPA: hypothetical protein PK280_19635 [Planctomycetota bacterium]|nr:hypothetical protein [Planctomycetota bacterium]
MNGSFETPFFTHLRSSVAGLGGFYNAHLHMDRSGTLEFERDLAGVSHLALATKHGLIPKIHASPAYDPEKLRTRMNWYLDAMIAAGATRAATTVDVTADRVGLSALEVFLQLKNERQGQMRLEIGAYSPLGYTDAEPQRWTLLERAADMADFIGSLPERDDRRDYPDHLGFREHCRRMIALSLRTGKSLHVHVDQRNEPSERGAETLVQVLEEVATQPTPAEEPWLWLIHLISPSTYQEVRFQRLLDGLVKHRIGVICCPSAAISMRQLRTIQTPTFNSIARIMDLLDAGIHVRIGSDNICDITSPAGTPDLMAEIYVLCNAIRFYDIGVLSRLAAGLPLTAAEQLRVRQHQEQDGQEARRVTAKLGNHGTEA